MIYIDQRTGSKELETPLKRLNATVEVTSLEFGDACFEGRGPNGPLAIGVERKTLHDMLACIEDARYSGHQRPGMKSLYDLSVLMIEGHWKPHDPDLFLMEGFNGGVSWGFCKFRAQRTMYAKLFRYLLSVQLSGVFVCYSRDITHTAINILEWYHYFQKPWDQHTAMLEPQKVSIPSLLTKPPLVKKWARAFEGVGVKMTDAIGRHFKTGFELANADELDLLKIPGIGVKTAQDIYKEIHGRKR